MVTAGGDEELHRLAFKAFKAVILAIDQAGTKPHIHKSSCLGGGMAELEAELTGISSTPSHAGVGVSSLGRVSELERADPAG